MGADLDNHEADGLHTPEGDQVSLVSRLMTRRLSVGIVAGVVAMMGTVSVALVLGGASGSQNSTDNKPAVQRLTGAELPETTDVPPSSVTVPVDEAQTTAGSTSAPTTALSPRRTETTQPSSPRLTPEESPVGRPTTTTTAVEPETTTTTEGRFSPPTTKDPGYVDIN